MKKTIKVLAIAAMASMTIVACNNNKPAEEPVDSTAIEQVAEEEQVAEPVEAIDTVAQAPAEETKAAPAKKATKTTKQEPKTFEKKTTTTNALEENAKKSEELKNPVKKEGGKFKRPTL